MSRGCCRGAARGCDDAGKGGEARKGGEGRDEVLGLKQVGCWKLEEEKGDIRVKRAY